MVEEKINVGVYGARGYVGGELCRLLLNHKHVDKIFPSSGEVEDFNRVHPNLNGCGLKFVRHSDLEDKVNLDVVFLSVPSGESMKVAPKFWNKGVSVIDLGSDFRLNKETYENVYGKEHTAPELLKEAVYGATELNRERIKNARLIANPGCYVITGLLGLYPLLKEGMIDMHHISINAINGMTGADSKPSRDTMQTSVSKNVLSYNMEGHRHSGEFEEKIEEISGYKPIVNFNASHGDFTTGIHLVASPLVKPKFDKLTRESLLAFYIRYYGNEEFIRIIHHSKGSGGISKVYDVYPQMRNIRGTNYCDIGLDYDKERGIVKVIAVADNLVRGSAGSAIQNMNVMRGFDEGEGLRLYSSP
ncbi:MAG: N-acetyl-gamma-glutamyl-phosphate reductase [Nanoarchaeota archaeon]